MGDSRSTQENWEERLKRKGIMTTNHTKRLGEIRNRLKLMHDKNGEAASGVAIISASLLAFQDVPFLLEEVERLQKELTDARVAWLATKKEKVCLLDKLVITIKALEFYAKKAINMAINTLKRMGAQCKK